MAGSVTWTLPHRKPEALSCSWPSNPEADLHCLLSPHVTLFYSYKGVSQIDGELDPIRFRIFLSSRAITCTETCMFIFKR